MASQRHDRMPHKQISKGFRPYLCNGQAYMSKPAVRSYSRYAREAAELFGHLLHDARVEKGLTIAAVAERAVISRGLVHRIKQGDMGCSLGAVFEVASILGVPLFDAEPATLARHLSLARDKLKLLPQALRQRTQPLKDDF